MNPNPVQQQMIAGFYTSRRNELIRYASARLPFPEESEDVVQDTFLRVLENGRMIQPETITSYIYTVLKNLICDRLRRFQRYQKIDNLMNDGSTVQSGNYTEYKVHENELMRLVRNNIHQLPPMCRRVYRLYFFNNFSVEDLSRRFSISKRTVETYIFDSRKKLRQEIAEQWEVAI